MDPQFSNNSRFQHNLVPGKTYDLSVIIAHSGHRKLSPKLASIAVQNFEVRLPLRCISPLLLLCKCYCCHDPFIVRSAQTCPPSTGFTQLTHPSRCSRSTLTTVCFCAADSSRDHVWSLCMCRGCNPLHLVKWSVGSMVKRIPILQTCNVVVILKQGLVSFRRLRNSSL